MSLPKFKSDDQSLTLMQSAWASQLDPVLKLPINSGVLLKSVPLLVGQNLVNHRLGRKLQGYFITRMRSIHSDIYDTQDSNRTPDLTLLLNSSAAVVVDILVF